MTKLLHMENMKRVYHLIIVDESQSMEKMEEWGIEQVVSIVSAVRKTKNECPEILHYVSCYGFNSMDWRYVYDRTEISEIEAVEDDFCLSCIGASPLYDARGTALTDLQASVNDSDEVHVTVISDGKENFSKKYDAMAVATLLGELKASGWHFAYVGTDEESLLSQKSKYSKVTFFPRTDWIALEYECKASEYDDDDLDDKDANDDYMLTMKRLIRRVVEELRDKAVCVPSAGSFEQIYAECEYDQNAMNLTHVLLRIVPAPAHVNPEGDLRYVEVVGYRLPLPFKSRLTIKRGTTNEIITYLNDVGAVVERVMEVVPQLGFNLIDV